MSETRPVTAIRIGELVLRGLSPAAARRAAAAFETELARLATTGPAVSRVPDGPLRLEVAAGDPRAIGAEAARSLHRRLTGGAS